LKKVIITVLSVTFLVFIIFLILGSLFTDKYINDEISKISNDQGPAKSIAGIDSLNSFPLVLNKYFGYAIIDSNASPKSVKINLSGKLKTDENSEWKNLIVEQYYSIAKPGYVWNSKLEMNRFVWARAIESYSSGKGNILIKLFSSIKISDAFGNPVDQSCLTRYLIESVFFPTALLPGGNLYWKFIDQGKLKAVIRDGSLNAEAVFYFNNIGQIVKIETSDRYRTIKTGYSKTQFSITFSDYKLFGGFNIPTSFSTNWHTEKGIFNFGKFNITGVQYN